MGAHTHTHTNSTESGSLQFILPSYITVAVVATVDSAKRRGQINGTAEQHRWFLVFRYILSRRAGVPNIFRGKRLCNR